MKQMLMVLFVGLTLFAVSGGVSLYLHQQEKDKQVEAAPAAGGEKVIAKAAAFTLPKLSAAAEPKEPAPATRPVASASPEHLAQLAGSIAKQQDALKTREQNLATRQKHLELIYQDLREERKTLDELRQRVGADIKLLSEKLEALDRKSGDIDKQKQKMQEHAKEIKQSMFEMDTVEQKRVKQIAAMYDTMDAETAGEILQQMADTGKMDTAVKVLATMQERQSAKVLAQMSDRGTVVQLLEMMKSLRRPAATSSP
jgi:flagellar motility protein MotE (MotC chaperone)